MLSEKILISNKYGENRKGKKYGKNSKNNKFNKILHLGREKVRRASRSSQISQKIAKVIRIFLLMWKDLVTNMAKIGRLTNLTKFYT